LLEATAGGLVSLRPSALGSMVNYPLANVIGHAIVCGLCAASLLCVRAVGRPHPNLQLVIADQWHWDWAGFDQPGVRTPELQKVAAHGTRFTHAYVPSPLCVPSRGAFAAGCEYDASPLPDNDIDFPINGSAPTIYQQLQLAGYHTMLAGKDHLSEKSGVGLDGQLHAKQLGFDDALRCMDKYETFLGGDLPTDPYRAWLADRNTSERQNAYAAYGKCYGVLGNGSCCDAVWKSRLQGFMCPRTELGEGLHIDEWVEAQTEALLTRKPRGKPWFLQVAFPSPHPPFILTPSMNKSVEGRLFPLACDHQNLSWEAQQTIRREYAALIENIDAALGRILERVASMGELSNTVVIVSSDHGEELGDHNRFDKMNPWDGSTRVPLVMQGPGIPVERVVSAAVATLDIGGTLLELAGATAAAGMTTRSLLPLLAGTADVGRRFIGSGLTRKRPGEQAIDWRMVVGRPGGATSALLKFICCLRGCPGSGDTRGRPEAFFV